MKRYELLALTVDAYRRCVAEKNIELMSMHFDSLSVIMKSAPSGSGIDNGTKFDASESSIDKLVFTFGFHHMDEYGFYDGWTQHTLKVRPCFVGGVSLTISGTDRNQIKEYLYELYDHWLTEEVERDGSPIRKGCDPPRVETKLMGVNTPGNTVYVPAGFYETPFVKANEEALCPRCGAMGRTRQLCVSCEEQGFTLTIGESGG